MLCIMYQCLMEIFLARRRKYDLIDEKLVRIPPCLIPIVFNDVLNWP